MENISWLKKDTFIQKTMKKLYIILKEKHKITFKTQFSQKKKFLVQKLSVFSWKAKILINMACYRGRACVYVHVLAAHAFQKKAFS